MTALSVSYVYFISVSYFNKKYILVGHTRVIHAVNRLSRLVLLDTLLYDTLVLNGLNCYSLLLMSYLYLNGLS